MFCEECGGVTDVIDSRPNVTLGHAKDMQIKVTRRRIACRHCGHRSTTYELYSKDVENIHPKSEAEKILDRISDLINNP